MTRGFVVFADSLECFIEEEVNNDETVFTIVQGNKEPSDSTAVKLKYAKIMDRHNLEPLTNEILHQKALEILAKHKIFEMTKVIVSNMAELSKEVLQKVKTDGELPIRPSNNFYEVRHYFIVPIFSFPLHYQRKHIRDKFKLQKTFSKPNGD